MQTTMIGYEIVGTAFCAGVGFYLGKALVETILGAIASRFVRYKVDRYTIDNDGTLIRKEQ